MPIGSSKLGVLGAGLVPGGTETFNAPGTFSIPPGVKKVNITGVGGVGNPGTTGTAGNAGEPGLGGTGGGASVSKQTPTEYVGTGGGRFNTFQPIAAANFTLGGFGGGLNPTACPPFPGRPFGCPVFQGQPGSTGPNGGSGSAGSVGDPGNTGQSSTALGNTFTGGAGGNGGAAGNAGTGGSGGGGGGGSTNNSNNTETSANKSAGSGGAGGGGAGGPAGMQFVSPCGPGFTYPVSGGGGGGAGATNDGSVGRQNPRPAPTGGLFGGGIGGTTTGFCVPALIGPTKASNPITAPFPPKGDCGDLFPDTAVANYPAQTSGGAGATYNVGSQGNSGAPVFCTGPTNPGAPGSTDPYINVPFMPNFPTDRIRFGQSYRKGGTAPFLPGWTINGFLNPVVSRNNSAVRSGAGGGSGAAPVGSPGQNLQNAGGGGGGRGNAGNAGGCGGGGGCGVAGTPATFNCVPVTPGCTAPITVGSPGGQIVISWNPQ
jgi:hypothetical protein